MDTWIETAHAAADAARAVTRRWYRASPPTEHKAAASPIVTLADQASEAAMRAIIRARHPDHSIHGEEASDFIGAPDAPTWVLDPIDGTIAFASGKPLFTTLIGLSIDGQSVLGLIDQSITDERWLGLPGTHTTLNTAPVTPSTETILSRCRLAATAPDMFSPAQQQAFSRLSSAVHVTTWGGDAYNYALLATGTIELVVEAGLSWYDWAAVSAVVRGAGGIITDWSGAPLRPGDADVVAASTPALHAQALSLLQSS
ncbi:MAG: inositol-phosphate phosphatase/L-galactose 1-phosphate phosphatase/histidinol-phosphatase [Myxococcota bacterium]|jgi:inositol-phosphate phosphatase/L-galactose 1-phosphate phosphatase/histidinol-phosphatase